MKHYECTALTNWATGPTYCSSITRVRERVQVTFSICGFHCEWLCHAREQNRWCMVGAVS